MTYKEKLTKAWPYAIDDSQWGGAAGCPGSYFDNAPKFGNSCHNECPYHDVPGNKNCRLCWNTEVPEDKKPEPKETQSKSILEWLDKALARGDQTIRLSVKEGDIIDIMVYPSEPEDEEEPQSEIGQLNEQEAKETIRFLQSKFKLAPEKDVVKHGCWREIRYHKDENGKRSLVEDGIKAYEIVNVYCPAAKRVYSAFWSDFKSKWMIAGTIRADSGVELPVEPTHWMSTPKPPKGE